MLHIMLRELGKRNFASSLKIDLTMYRELILILSLTILTAFSTLGQETKQTKNENKEGDLEIFHVLKSDKNIKHGPYEKYFKFSNPVTRVKLLTEKGQYDNNKKTGTWSFYWGENNMTSK